MIFCASIKMITSFFNNWHYVSIIIILFLSLTSFLSFKIFINLKDSGRHWNNIIWFKITLFCNLLLFLIMTITYVFRGMLNKDLATLLVILFNLVTVLYPLWFISWFISIMFLPPDLRNVYKHKVKRFFLKILIFSIISFTISFIQIYNSASIVAVVFTILTSLVGTNEFLSMFQLFSKNAFSDKEFNKLALKLDKKLLKLKVIILLAEFSSLLSFYLVNTYKINIKNCNSFLVAFFIAVILFVILIFILSFLCSKAYLNIMKKLAK